MSTGTADHSTTSPAPATELAAGPRRTQVTVAADDVARVRAGLTAVLGRLLHGHGAGAPAMGSHEARAADGVDAVLPAVLAQQGLRALLTGQGPAEQDAAGGGPAGGERTSMPGAAWDGLVHRRSRIESVGACAGGRGIGVRAGDAAVGGGTGPWAGDVVVTSWVESRDARGGWVLLRVGSRGEVVAVGLPQGAGTVTGPVVGAGTSTGYLVTDELVRWPQPAVAAVATDLSVRPGRSRRPSGPISPSIGTDLAGVVRLARQDVARWAAASGDRNAVHLVPGQAARAGLDAGPDDVVAHGLLLAALSAALVPTLSGTLDVRMPAPAVLPGPGAGGEAATPTGFVPLAVDLSTGDVTSRGRTVLHRV